MYCMWKYICVNRRLSFCGWAIKITHQEWSGPSFSSEMSRDYNRKRNESFMHTQCTSII